MNRKKKNKFKPVYFCGLAFLTRKGGKRMIQFQNEHLTVFQSALYQTTCAVIQSEKAVILIDPNWLPQEIEIINAYIAGIIEGRQLFIIFTHSDFDHIIAAGAFPNAIKIASKAFVEQPNKAAILEEIQQFDAQYYVERLYPIIYPTIDLVIDEDAQQLVLGDITCTFYLAPGHTDDGIFIAIDSLKLMLAGDYLSDVEFPFLTDFQAYLTTLQKAQMIVEQYEIQLLVPGHGKTTASSSEIMERIKESRRYLQQLQQGIDQEQHLKARYLFYRSLKDLHELNKKQAP